MNRFYTVSSYWRQGGHGVRGSFWPLSKAKHGYLYSAWSDHSGMGLIKTMQLSLTLDNSLPHRLQERVFISFSSSFYPQTQSFVLLYSLLAITLLVCLHGIWYPKPVVKGLKRFKLRLHVHHLSTLIQSMRRSKTKRSFEGKNCANSIPLQSALSFYPNHTDIFKTHTSWGSWI